MTQGKFFMMMYGGLFLTVLVFSIVAFFIVTRKNFKAHGVDSEQKLADDSGAEEASAATVATAAENKAVADQAAPDNH